MVQSGYEQSTEIEGEDRSPRIGFGEYLISEGVYDKSIFKAIWLAGGPGSGKSYVQGRVASGLGLKVVNSDDAFTMLLKKHGLSLKMPDAEEQKRNTQLTRAKSITAKRIGLMLQGRLGMVIDGTGGNYKAIRSQMKSFQKLGYDTYMVFVNTSLETALERNKKRDRQVPEPIVASSHKAVQSNIGKFQTLFKPNNFYIIDNNDANEDLLARASKEVRKIINQPVKDRRAQKWIKTELEAKGARR